MEDYRLAAAQGMLWGIAVSAVLWDLVIGTCYVIRTNAMQPPTEYPYISSSKS